MTDYLTTLGQHHLKFRGYGLKSDHWILFKMSIMLSIAFTCEIDIKKDDLLVK